MRRCGKTATAFRRRTDAAGGGSREGAPVMYARAVEDAATRLRDLRREEWEDFGLAALALTLAVAAAYLQPAFALPLFVGGLAVGARGVQALWRRWDLID